MTLIITGKVQRVGFRYSVVDFVQTNKLSIVGHVRNLPDGSVHVLAQGDLEALKELHRFCSKGPSKAQVREISQELLPIKRPEFFEFVALTD